MCSFSFVEIYPSVAIVVDKLNWKTNKKHLKKLCYLIELSSKSQKSSANYMHKEIYVYEFPSI